MESVIIEKLIPGGQALGTLENGKKVMLWNALPGEKVIKWQITKNKSSFIEGVAETVETPSSFRITPQDQCYLATSPFQILDYQYELQQKHEILLEILRQQKLIVEPFEVSSVATDGNDFYYRNKMEYALYYDKADQKIYPAFRERGSHHKVSVTKSSLERPEIWRKAQEIIDELNAQKQDARRYQSLLLRANQKGEVSGGLLENHKPHPHFAKLTDQILGRTYSYSPNGFFQINLPVYESVLTEIQNWIKTEQVLDLYAGVGTIGLSVARDKDLTLVECDKSAYCELKNNCQGTSAHPVLAKTEEALDYIAPQQTVIVDPPRAGCYKAVIEKILTTKPTTVIYLSCNPITQARDVAMLLKVYAIKLVQPYNFFPRTPHLENLIILERR